MLTSLHRWLDKQGTQVKEYTENEKDTQINKHTNRIDRIIVYKIHHRGFNVIMLSVISLHNLAMMQLQVTIAARYPWECTMLCLHHVNTVRL